MESKGFFVTFEGIDHSGKNTQMLLVNQGLEGSGYPHGFYGEPNDMYAVWGCNYSKFVVIIPANSYF